MKPIINKAHRNSYHPLELTRIEIKAIVGISPEYEKTLIYTVTLPRVEPHPYGKDMEIQIDPLKIPWKELKTIRIKKNG